MSVVIKNGFQVTKIFNDENAPVGTVLIFRSMLLAAPYSRKINADARNALVKPCQAMRQSIHLTAEGVR